MMMYRDWICGCAMFMQWAVCQTARGSIPLVADRPKELLTQRTCHAPGVYV